MRKIFVAFVSLCSLLSAQMTMVPRVTLKHLEADGVGFDGGYTTLEGMFGFLFGTRHLPFIDARWHVLNRGKMAVNVGGGYRYDVAGSGVLLGINGYYDQRATTGQAFHQISGGVEMLSDALDFRANGYFPIWTAKEVRSAQLVGFQEHNLLLRVRERMALTGMNAEFGTSIGHIGWANFYAAAGAYYFKRQACNTKVGFQSRIKGTWRDNVWAEVSLYHDQLYHTNVQGTLGVSIPFWPKPRTRPSRNYFPNRDAFLIQPVQMQELIVLCDDRRNVVATSPEGQELFFIFVDNTSGSNGTIESPFPTLKQGEAASSPGDFIYVFSGDGTVMGMDQGIVLQNDQSLLGASLDHTVQTQFGPFTIPAMSPQPPKITNIAGTCVGLADGVLVSGFDIPGAVGNGLFGSNVQDVTLASLNVTGSGMHALNLIADNQETTSATISDSSFNMSLGNGFSAISTNNSTIDVDMDDCDVSLNGANGVLFTGDDRSSFTVDFTRVTSNTNSTAGLNLDGGNASFFFTATDCMSNGNLAEGMLLTSTDFVLGTLSFTGSSFNGNGSMGVNINADQKSECTLMLDSCTINNNSSDGVNLQSLNESQFTFTVKDNTVDGNGAHGLDFIAQDTAVLNFTVTDNTISNSTLHGMEFDGEDFSVCTGVVTGNTMTMSGSNGFDLQTIDNALFNFTLTNNTIDGAGIDGLNIFANNVSTFNATMNNNTIRNTVSNGFDIETQLATTMAMDINNNVLESIGVDGFDILIENTATFNGTFNGNTVTNPGGHGFDIEVENNTVNIFTVTNNVITGAGSDGIDVLTENNGSFTGTISGNTITSAGTIGLDLESENNTGFTVTVENNTITSPGNNGIELRCETTSNTNGTFRGNTITGAGADGFEIDAVGSSTITAVIENNTISGNTGDGFDIVGTGGAVTATLTLRNNTIESNTVRGMFLTGAQNRIYTITVEDNRINNNGNDGIFARAINTSTYACAINNNTVLGNGATGVEVRAQNTASMCLQLLGNTSTTYFLDHAGGATYSVESPDGTIPGMEAANTGTFTVDAAVVPVAIGTCGFPPP